jgi:flagellar biosynthetic protein FliP
MTHPRRVWAGLLLALLMVPCTATASQAPAPMRTRVNVPLGDDPPSATTATAPLPDPGASLATAIDASPAVREAMGRTLPTVALFALASLVPAALLMVTAYVRINIVLLLLRQALGSPQVPGNQILAGLSLLLTAIVMMPTMTRVYDHAVAPYAAGSLGAADAWTAGTTPLKVFMVEQIVRTNHTDYLWRLYDHAQAASGQTPEPDPTRYDAFPLRVVAPAFLLSELTTALMIGFAVYLPFLVIDLVVSAVLAATGLVMLPPSLVAMPLKLLLFVLADGWMLVADMLLRSFSGGSG